MIRCRGILKHSLPAGRLLQRQGIHATPARRNGANEDIYDPKAIERVEDETDVCIVGAGPAGLSAAIRIKQLEREKGKDVRVVVLEKGGEVPISSLVVYLNREHSTNYWAATTSKMLYLTEKSALPIPHPPQMGNNGNYIISLSAFTRWLATVAEQHFGVEIYPGFSGAGLLFSEDATAEDPWNGWDGKWGKEVTRISPKSSPTSSEKVRSVQGVITNDVGISRTGRLKSNFEPGMMFRSKVTLLAEGAHGSLSKLVLGRYNLRKESEPQTYGFGVKEVWRVVGEDGSQNDGRYRPGEVVHTLGWPIESQTYGGGWVYHMDGGLVSLGLVIGADWKNPYREPYRDMQMMKHHPYFRKLLTASDSSFTPTRVAYGARVLTEGGLQSIPLLHFPGGALIGCSAGFVNIAKIKGVHNAMKTGMLGGEGAFNALETADEDTPTDLSSYSRAFSKSWVYDDLNEVRNIRPSFATNLGLWGGVAYSGIDTLLLKGRTPWTFRHTKEETRKEYINATPSFDSAHTEPASKHKPIKYPPFEPPLSTDLMTSVMLTATNHVEDQDYIKEWYDEGEEGELDVKIRRRKHVDVNVGKYAGLLGRACPAGVYEYVDDEASKISENGEGAKGKKLVINAQNCIHCKLCDVKVPSQDITWTVPEGGGGPKYTVT
ncbi:hypothetical protein EDD18DRAFT_1437631 [Armillaria luteobubalina]|uniref:Electron transfer flavoprotein-ubiquinone oxidoreductase n=1 Tax=Armillaria luteobubalina TaxID=153913 RepID=A0AA39QEF8_9AGAR|nr:hypothetical protein EDD18DRAFT_1437631 [Armillaria luteobubalina]